MRAIFTRNHKPMHQPLVPAAVFLMILAFLLLSKRQLVDCGYLSDSDHQETDRESVPPPQLPTPPLAAPGIGTGIAETDAFGPFVRSS